MSKLASNKDYLWPSAQLLRAGVWVLVQIGPQAGVGEQCATAEEGRGPPDESSGSGDSLALSTSP